MATRKKVEKATGNHRELKEPVRPRNNMLTKGAVNSCGNSG